MVKSLFTDKTFLGFVIYVLVLLAGFFLIPADRLDPYAKNLLFIIGIVGIWRYTWFLINGIRAYIYRRFKFKAIREYEQQAGKELDPDHVFLLITTFRISTEVTIKVYKAAIEEAITSGYNVSVIASIVEMSEERLIRKIFLELDPPERVKLIITRIKGTGKRDALAAGFKVVANANVDFDRSVVAVIDGDSILTKDSVKKTARLFMLNEKLGALTTDEEEDDHLLVYGEGLAEKIYYYWYKLRFAQRNMSMSSIALSDRILTLTGRMSLIRASIAKERYFANIVQMDELKHWRLGEFYFLTGDDKSSWFAVASEGWEMWYVPDVLVYTVDEIPERNFFKGSIMLMTRWFGNQYRTNSRALHLSHDRLNLYPWYALIDQRITKWTTLYGLALAVLGAFKWGFGVFYAYVWWILFTRLLMIFVYRFSRKNILPIWPLFLYYNQVVGSLVKIYVWEHLYKQKWTRQKTTLKGAAGFTEWYRKVSSDGMVILDLLVFLIFIAFLVQLLTFDDVFNFIHFLKGV